MFFISTENFTCHTYEKKSNTIDLFIWRSLQKMICWQIMQICRKGIGISFSNELEISLKLLLCDFCSAKASASLRLCGF